MVTDNDISQSILLSIKKLLGIESDHTVFDTEIMIHINSVFGTLNQLGIGPESGFEITDIDDAWPDYVTGFNLNAVKTYIYLKVRLLFDPPSSSFALDAIKSQIQELEWRLNVEAEKDRYGATVYSGSGGE